MDIKVTATELARRLGDVLGRIRYRRETFLVERNGRPVARLVPVAEAPEATLADAVNAWRGAAGPDEGFADDLEQVRAADRVPETPWGS
jgi:prevent-host-death family protein